MLGIAKGAEVGLAEHCAQDDIGVAHSQDKRLRPTLVYEFVRSAIR